MVPIIRMRSLLIAIRSTYVQLDQYPSCFSFSRVMCLNVNGKIGIIVRYTASDHMGRVSGTICAKRGVALRGKRLLCTPAKKKKKKKNDDSRIVAPIEQKRHNLGPEKIILFGLGH
jgi:hypothetical protein